jgi:hypothetical protein
MHARSLVACGSQGGGFKVPRSRQAEVQSVSELAQVVRETQIV